MAPQDEGDAVAEAAHVHRAAVFHHVGPGLHLRNALALVHDLVQRRTAPQVQGHQAAGQLGDPVLEASGLAERTEDLKGSPSSPRQTVT